VGITAGQTDLLGNDNKFNIQDIGHFLFPLRPVDDGHGTFSMFSHVLDDDGDTVIESNEDPSVEPGGIYLQPGPF